MFFGTIDGKVIEAEVGGSDDGEIYTASFVGLFDDCGTPASLKTGLLARATFLSVGSTGAQISISSDYVVSLPAAPSVAPPATGGNLWDSGVWNSSMWGDTVSQTREATWQSVSGTGSSLAPGVQISIGGEVEPQIDLVSFDLVYQTAAIVT
jgi:hypothetical protein